MSNEIPTIDELFSCAINLEKNTEQLYRKMGKLFSHDYAVAQFWSHYADEERGHALYLQHIKDGMDPGRLSLAADREIMMNAQNCLFRISRKEVDHIQNLEDAYELATELENAETNTIFEFIITNFSADELSKSRKFLRAQLNEHIVRLETSLPIKYRSSAARRGLLVIREMAGCL
jgi:rubrerythrin